MEHLRLREKRIHSMVLQAREMHGTDARMSSSVCVRVPETPLVSLFISPP